MRHVAIIWTELTTDDRQYRKPLDTPLKCWVVPEGDVAKRLTALRRHRAYTKKIKEGTGAFSIVDIFD